MPDQIRTIRLPLPLGMGKVNSYLIQTSTGFVLIDSGGSNARKHLGAALQEAGCQPGTLKLIVITHGDYDHTGNAAHLRQRFGAEIAMHPGDLGMAVDGDMFYNRSHLQTHACASSSRCSPALAKRSASPRMCCSKTGSRWTPGAMTPGDLHPRSFERLDWHPERGGELFCGDLLVNQGTPELNTIMDDLPAARASLDLLRSLRIAMIYPGHGEPFTLEQIPA